jgi:hypothetical protein
VFLTAAFLCWLLKVLVCVVLVLCHLCVGIGWLLFSLKFKVSGFLAWFSLEPPGIEELDYGSYLNSVFTGILSLCCGEGGAALPLSGVCVDSRCPSDLHGHLCEGGMPWHWGKVVPLTASCVTSPDASEWGWPPHCWVIEVDVPDSHQSPRSPLQHGDAVVWIWNVPQRLGHHPMAVLEAGGTFRSRV